MNEDLSVFIVKEFIPLFRKMVKYRHIAIICYSYKTELFALNEKIQRTSLYQKIKDKIEKDINQYSAIENEKKEEVYRFFECLCLALEPKDLTTQELYYYITRWIPVICGLMEG